MCQIPLTYYCSAQTIWPRDLKSSKYVPEYNGFSKLKNFEGGFRGFRYKGERNNRILNLTGPKMCRINYLKLLYQRFCSKPQISWVITGKLDFPHHQIRNLLQYIFAKYHSPIIPQHKLFCLETFYGTFTMDFKNFIICVKKYVIVLLKCSIWYDD